MQTQLYNSRLRVAAQVREWEELARSRVSTFLCWGTASKWQGILQFQINMVEFDLVLLNLI